MRTRNRVLLLSLVALSLAAAGCVPSDAEIAADMDATRRAAYHEWKARRESGDTMEVQVDGPLGIDDAVKLALQYNKPLQSMVQKRDVTRGERISAYAVVLPSLAMTGGAHRSELGRGNSDIDTYSFGVTVRQPVFDGGGIPARLRNARLNTALTDEEIRETVQNLISAVAGNYYDVLLAQHMVEVQREALTSAETQYRMVSEKKKQETATEYDVLRAQVDVATYRAKMISAQNSIDTNRVSLLKNLGVSQDSRIAFSDKLEFLPMRPVFERAVEIASGLRPDLRQAEISARMAEEAVRIARSAFWPAISGTFSQNWSDSWAGDAFGRQPWRAGFGLDYSFGADTLGELRSQRARARQAQINVLDKQETTLQEIRQYMNSIANAEEMVKALEVNQDAAREALRLVLVGYEAGVKTEVDVTDARKALTEVMGQYYEALADHTKARLNLQVAMGVLGPSLVTDRAPLPPRVPIANIEEFAATDYVPPTPIPMPAANDPRPAPRLSPAEPLSARPIQPREPQVSARPGVAPVRATVPAPPAETTPAMADNGPIVSTPLLSASDLPLPSGEPAPRTAQPVMQAPPGQTIAAPLPATTAQAETRAERPLFRIRVREGTRDIPEMANAGQ